MQVRERLGSKLFDVVHQKNLVYNACWEDPRLDRAALDLGPEDRVVMITSAGCNALDYLLREPQHVHAIDMNPRQNALLELKIAGIRRLDYEQFFAMFGRGRIPHCRAVYETELRAELSYEARAYWDRRIDFFSTTQKRSFYFRGTSGAFARLVNLYIDRVAKVRPDVERILNAETVEEQCEIYHARLKGALWTKLVRWAVGRDALLWLLGVPGAQRQQVERDYLGGIVQFIEDSVETVFARLPLVDNYFWRVYLTGEYTTTCCPEYLKRDNFEKLQLGLTDRLSTHTCSLTDFLLQPGEPVTRFVLLDHMDWMSTNQAQALGHEWQAIVDRAAPNCRILWRSGGLRSDFVDRVRVDFRGERRLVGDLLNHHRGLADQLHAQDRVHTYGSFWIADLCSD